MLFQSLWQNNTYLLRWTNAPQFMEFTQSRDVLYGQNTFTSGLLNNNGIPCWNLHCRRLENGWKQLLGTKITERNNPLKSFQQLFEDNGGILKIFLAPNWQAKSFKLSLIPVSINNAALEIPNFFEIRLELRNNIPTVGEKKLITVQKHQRSWSSELKTSNYLAELAAYYGQGVDSEFNEILFIDCEGNVAELIFSSLIIFKDNNFIFPTSEYNALEGLSAWLLKNGMKENGMQFYEQKISQELLADSLVWCCNMLRGVEPVDKINGKQLKRDGEMEKQLSGLLKQQINKQDYLKLELNYE